LLCPQFSETPSVRGIDQRASPSWSTMLATSLFSRRR
jgi:hypothetical protein